MPSIEEIHRISELQAPAFIIFFCAITFSEFYTPLRKLSQGRSHFLYNMGLTLLNFALLGGFSFCMVEYSFYAFQNGYGLWNLIGWTTVPMVLAQIFLYDLLNYFIHKSFHTTDRLWKFHKVHHSDTAMDATSTFRFHPVEGLYRLFCQGIFIAITGMHPFAIIGYSLLAIPVFLISHGNVKLPIKFERFFGKLIVLPRDHSIHHHPERVFHDTNFGTAFMIWDHLLGTYTDPSDLEEVVPVGLQGYRQDLPATVGDMLSDPWRDLQATPHNGDAKI